VKLTRNKPVSSAIGNDDAVSLEAEKELINEPLYAHQLMLNASSEVFRKLFAPEKKIEFHNPSIVDKTKPKIRFELFEWMVMAEN